MRLAVDLLTPVDHIVIECEALYRDKSSTMISQPVLGNPLCLTSKV